MRRRWLAGAALLALGVAGCGELETPVAARTAPPPSPDYTVTVVGGDGFGKVIYVIEDRVHGHAHLVFCRRTGDGSAAVKLDQWPLTPPR